MAMITCPECGKDISDQASQCPYCGCLLRRKIFYQTVGGYVTFGHYPQTEKGNDHTPIEWLVLEYDEKNNRALLLSRYGLDAKPYNQKCIFTEWAECTLRTRLNGEFLNKAFSGEEQKAILMTAVDNDDSQEFDFTTVSVWAEEPIGGFNTQDKVFLLSYAEANRYLNVTYDNRNNMESRVSPTAYAKKNGAWTVYNKKTADGAAAVGWWLRSPGFDRDIAAIVNAVGYLDCNSVTYSGASVRPALWINLESDIF